MKIIIVFGMFLTGFIVQYGKPIIPSTDYQSDAGFLD